MGKGKVNLKMPKRAHLDRNQRMAAVHRKVPRARRDHVVKRMKDLDLGILKKRRRLEIDRLRGASWLIGVNVVILPRCKSAKMAMNEG